MRVFVLVLASLLLSPLQAGGDAKLPWEEYDKLISARTTAEPLGTDLFGDQINLYNTGLSFSVTDISLPGNHDLPVALTRTFSVKSRKLNAQKDLPMATWDLDLPRLEGVFAATTSHPAWPNNRCEGNGVPPDVTVPGGNNYPSNQYWHGNHAHMPGGGEIIRADRGATQPDTSDDWRWMTSNFTYFSCLTSIQNGPGEGFLAITADGTRYWFDWMAQYHEESLQSPETSDGPPEDDPPEGEPPEDEPPDDDPLEGAGLLTRKRNVLYATRVEDRFGNYVEYTFTNDHDQPAKLTAITASDDRVILLTYDTQGRVVAASDGTGTSWGYHYDSGHLSEVILPDDSRWTINFGGLWDVEIEYSNEPNTPRNCTMTAPFIGLRGGSGTVTHPSGATGEFEVQRVLHGRNNVPKACINWKFGGNNDPNDDIAVWPRQYDLLGIKKKRISGPGLTTMEWTFASGATFSWAQGTSGPACEDEPPLSPCDDPDWPGCSGQIGCGNPVCLDDKCAGTAVTGVLGPNGERTRYTFGNSYRYNEGKLLKVEYDTIFDLLPLRTEEMQYELTQPRQQPGLPFPVPVGTSPNNRGDVFAAAYLAPLKQRTITQQGTDFDWEVKSFDEFARPIDVLRFNSQGEKRAEVTTYHDNLSKWVLGQIAQRTANGLVAEETTYDPTWAVPLESKRFGKTVQTLSWDTASSIANGQLGTVETVTDGNNNVTTVSNWKRGIPQLIDYADGESASALVNDDGTLASVTDENGYKTCYHYDGLGRLEQITYPSESEDGVCDNSTWNVTYQTFEQVDGSEYGIGAGHWRQTVNTGDGYKNTYFDALWRPLLVQEYDDADQSGTERFSRFEYDHEGRTTFTSYPGTSSSVNTGTRTTYDRLGRVRMVVQDSELGPLTTTTEYLKDALGYHTQVTDPRGKVTRTWYQAFDQPDYETPLMHAHPEGAYTVFARDSLGQVDWIRRQDLVDESLLGSLDWNQVLNGDDYTLSARRDYVYNGHRELCKIVEPETGATIMAYDGAGNLAWSKSGSSHTGTTSCNSGDIPEAERTTRAYDERNRAIELRFPDGRGDTDYAYWPDGKLWTLSAYLDGDVDTITQYVYYRRSLLSSEHQHVVSEGGSIAMSTLYNYNANGHLSSQRWWYVDLDVDFEPNALGQPTRAGDYATNVSYYPNGAVKEFTYGNGIVHTLTQNARGLPDTSTDAHGGTNFVADSYDYDANGNVAAITDGATGTNQRGNRDMVYDGLNRLTEVTSSMFGTATYAYDELDNLTRVKLTDGTAARDYYLCYASSTNRLDTVRTGGCGGSTVTSFGYDVQGNVTGKDGTTFDFDHGNRLREVVGTQTSTYRYDGHGRRVNDFVSGLDGGHKQSHYLMDGRLSSTNDERRGTNESVESFYIYLGSRLVAIHEHEWDTGSATVKYQHTDALGSPVAVTDESRNVLERSEYEPYGAVLNRSLRDGPGYTGHVEDAATGLNYMQQRYYDPAIGRFLSADPVEADWETGANFNRYWYANNNPYTNVDPDGRNCVSKDDQTTCEFEVTGSRIPRSVTFQTPGNVLTSGSNNKIPLPSHNVRPGGRGTNLDDAARARQGLAPRTRFQNAQSSRDLKDFGSPGRGRPGRQVREFTGNFNDAAQLIRQFSPSGRLTRTGTILDKRSGQAIGARFRGSNGETFTLRARSRGGPATPGQYDGPPAVDIVYRDGTKISIKFIERQLPPSGL